MNANPRQTLKRNLVVTVWNANGVVGKHEELVEFVARHKPDVLLLGEPHHTHGKRFRLPNYVCHRDDLIGQAGGGTAVAVKESIRHHLVSLPQPQHLEAVKRRLRCTQEGSHGWRPELQALRLG